MNRSVQVSKSLRENETINLFSKELRHRHLYLHHFKKLKNIVKNDTAFH